MGTEGGANHAVEAEIAERSGIGSEQAMGVFISTVKTQVNALSDTGITRHIPIPLDNKNAQDMKDKMFSLLCSVSIVENPSLIKDSYGIFLTVELTRQALTTRRHDSAGGVIPGSWEKWGPYDGGKRVHIHIEPKGSERGHKIHSSLCKISKENVLDFDRPSSSGLKFVCSDEQKAFILALLRDKEVIG